MARPQLWRGLALALALLLPGGLAHGQFVVNQGRLPGGSNNNSTTENVDFADIDGDGDWDVSMADGGDFGNDQNRIWVNLGGDQGGTIGFFTDVTSTQAPSISDDSRDIEFADIDDDGDPDIYVSNTAQLSTQGNRWWVNMGGEQGGTAGVYVDDTAARWVGLGGAGSSIPASQLTGGTFIDWSCDCDFGDLDNDGDLDLVHSTYGGSFGGNVPTRIFLNDGNGVFSEFNPSGFQLTGTNIANGTPGLWCDGNQQSNTTNSNGSLCDIASSALDIDVGDIDGDFDLDILHGARQELPRMFANRLDGSSLAPAMGGGALGFRDVTGAVFPSNYSTGDGHYEQEMGDLDGDGDLDIYGLNWRVQFGLDDITLRNTGNGVYDSVTILSGSGSDDNEGDFFDYDNDGDLDLYVANFSGQDKLYRNNENGSGTFSYTLVSLPSFGITSLDADCCDVDNDGDYDVLVAADSFTANVFLENITGTPDTHAPYIPNVEVPAAQVAHTGPVPVRAQVYDNAPYYITWYNPTFVDISVDGCDIATIAAKSSAGQIFRAELPGNLVGSVSYEFRSMDEYGNTGVSATQTYDATSPLSYAMLFGTGSMGTLGEPAIDALSVPFAGTTFYLAGSNAPPATPYILAVGAASLPTPFQFSNILLANVLPPFYALVFGVTDANGCALLTVPLSDTAPAGLNVYAQFFSLNGIVDFYASSKGLKITLQ
jgi:hypothetical protein